LTDLMIGLLSFPALLALVFLRVPIGLAMFLAGFIGLVLVTGDISLPFARLKSETYTTFSSYSLSIVPMFLLMGHFATLGGMSQALFKAAEGWLGHRKGGVAMAAVGACAGFGAICGSSLATAATMSRVALPELRRYGYSGGFSTATLAAGGTLGILIPPSIVLVIYAILTEQNIAKLFLAAFIPGILAAIGYMLTISIYVRIHPESAGTRPRVAYLDRFKAFIKIWHVLLLFLLVVGGIYLGCFIVLGAAFYNGFLAITQVPQEAAMWVAQSGYNPWHILILILVFYLLLGCLMDSLSMILLTIPIFWPVVQELDFNLVTMVELQSYKLDALIASGAELSTSALEKAQTMLSSGQELTREITRELGLRGVSKGSLRGANIEHTAIWFGILILIVVEVGLITPPVGMNLFVINAMDPKTPMSETYRAVLYFVASDLVRVAILVAFPIITLVLLPL
jgi:C4-dicarboxylate transporter DctM subunit